MTDAFVEIGAVSNAAVTSWVDVAVSPKSAYTYALSVVNTNELESDRRFAQVSTPAGMDYPFLDNGEGGAAMWTADAPWALGTGEFFSTSHAWTDSPDGAYTNGQNIALTLAAPMSLAAAVRPVLSYVHRYDILAGDNPSVEISTNNGSSWVVLANYTAASTTWQRARHDLSAYAGATQVRIRFRLSADASGVADGWWVDDIACGEALDPVDALGPTDITSASMRIPWVPNTNENFSHYVVTRSTSAGSGINSLHVATLYDQTTNGFTDTGLTLDTLYYYRVYAVSRQGIYSANGAESSARTLNNPIPFTEDFEGGLSAWEFSGSWGVTMSESHGGTTSLTDSPSGAYSNSVDSWARTAVDVSGSTWPVLVFWDRYSMAGGDWASVEISSDGVSWSRYYCVSGSQTDWREKRIDLSPWKNATNLRIRFRLFTNGDTTDDGWYVDDVRVEEHGAPGLADLPYYERFEDGGLTNWLGGSWKATTNAALDGSYSAVDTEGWTYGPDGTAVMTLGRGLRLGGTTNPVVTMWMKGQLWYRTRLRVEMSADGGVSWGNVAAYNNDVNWTNWTRIQASVPVGYRVDGAQLRVYMFSEWGTQPDQNWYVDKLTIEEVPPGVLLYTPSDITTHSMRLTWSAYTNDDFESYRVYRPTAAGVSESSVLLTTITDPGATNYTDTGLQAVTRYYYRVYVVNTNGTTSGSNETYERTRGAELPFSDDFESSRPVWTFTGSWGLQSSAGRNGGVALTDSPADYSNNSDTYALIGISLTNTTWPILRFWDRANIAENDWGWLEISENDGASWSRVYGIYGMHNEWREHVIDLSAWKPYSNLWVRFRLLTDGATTADGWYIDDLAVEEHADTPVSSFYDGFETGLGAWIDGGWTIDTNAYDGSACARDFAYGRIPPSVSRYLVYGSSLDLGGVTNPVLTYWYKGVLSYRTRFRAQITTNGGITWVDLHSLNYDYNQGWLRFQASLAAYTGSMARFRFVTWSEWDTSPDIDMYVDNVGVGGPTPSAPILAAPGMYEAVAVLRPMLSVTNASDPQSDPLTYRFEVYADEHLSNLVAQVPAIASGATTTTWEVDVNLDNNAQYWWRCRASDGSNDGPWMATATFYINETNTPPNVVSIAGPPKGATLRTATGILSWYPGTDPDVGDAIIRYHIQVDDEAGFGSPEMDCEFDGPVPAPTGAYVTIARPLNTLAG